MSDSKVAVQKLNAIIADIDTIHNRVSLAWYTATGQPPLGPQGMALFDTPKDALRHIKSQLDDILRMRREIRAFDTSEYSAIIAQLENGVTGMQLNDNYPDALIEQLLAECVGY